MSYYRHFHCRYGYSWDGMFPLQQEAAEHLFTQDGIEVFRIYEDGTEGAVTSLTDLQEHAEKGGLFGVEKETWEALHEYNAMKQQLRESEPTKEALLLYGKEDSYGIYQLARGDATRDLHFEPYDRLQAAGHTVERANYELIYTAPLAPGTSLEDIYTRFNIDHPKDFKGHSLSVSDIVVLHQNGGNTAHYVDSIGFQNVPEFLQEKQPQLIPDEHLTGEQIKTPRGSFYVSDMSVEQMKEAGYGLHHQSDDGKYLIMGNGTRAFAVAAEQPEKANPFRHVKEQALPVDNYTLLYEHGERVQPAGQYLDGNPDPQLGKFERFEAQPNDPEALHFLMREEKRSYDRLKPGDFKAHITVLHDSRIEAEAQRILAEMKRQDSPNSPNKTHFMVELSPYFMQLASTKDTDRLFAMLPYKTLSFSKIEGRHGTFAFLDKSEDRSRNIRKARPSVRAQLTADKKTAAPKKAAAKRKNHDLEV